VHGIALLGHNGIGAQFTGSYGGHESPDAAAHAQHICLNTFYLHPSLLKKIAVPSIFLK
jgi:hypothetical protein